MHAGTKIFVLRATADLHRVKVAQVGLVQLRAVEFAEIRHGLQAVAFSVRAKFRFRGAQFGIESVNIVNDVLHYRAGQKD